MQRILVESKAMASAGYDPETLCLEIAFRDGTIYQYRDVPPDLWSALLRSESKGKFLNAEIRGRFAHKIIPVAIT